MKALAWALVGAVSLLLIGAVGLEVTERIVFPVWEPNFFTESPGQAGEFPFFEKRTDLEKEIDGEKYGVNIFVPEGTAREVPAFFWVNGSNVQTYYHQSLHETMASWGYLVVVPDTPPFSFTDLDYHKVILEVTSEALSTAKRGGFGVNVDEDRIAAGGYSVGASLAAFTAAENPEVSTLVFWAPSGAPYWLGVNGDELYSRVTGSALYVLGEFDDSAPPEGGYPATMMKLTPGLNSEVFVVEGGNHHNFQQPTGGEGFARSSEIPRFEQQRIAINKTRRWLGEKLQ
ncbi:hypothetical protein KGY64_06135 [Candidatus Bipolaricaulota bacterium]|nr:hypothetical protein [Candidatus Bipolaricaulota bacterium]